MAMQHRLARVTETLILKKKINNSTNKHFQFANENDYTGVSLSGRSLFGPS